MFTDTKKIQIGDSLDKNRVNVAGQGLHADTGQHFQARNSRASRSSGGLDLTPSSTNLLAADQQKSGLRPSYGHVHIFRTRFSKSLGQNENANTNNFALWSPPPKKKCLAKC